MPTYTSLIQALGASALLTLVPYVQATDAERGRLLYENHCTTCHESVVHIRSDRKARSLGEVIWQVSRWATELRLDWRYDEVSDVLDYLNTNFYRFEKSVECP